MDKQAEIELSEYSDLRSGSPEQPGMELKCYLYPGWKPRIRPASSRRGWMDAAPEAFPYRCLPLAIANSHGWEILSPCGFEAIWNGGPKPEDVTIFLDDGTADHDAPVALFGQGVITFHVAALFRTAPGWNISVGGSPNAAKDGISPLSGIIETDWSPYSFTMNWRFTRANHRIRFEENEPFCFVSLVERNRIETVEPQFLPIDDDPALKQQFEDWSRSRDDFHRQIAANCPADPKDKWQKLYYRGIDSNGVAAISDHRTKLHVQPFGGAKPEEAVARCPASEHAANPPVPEHAANPPAPESPLATALAKRDWLLQVQERFRRLSPQASSIFRKEHLGTEEFLNDHYAAGRPVILGNAIADWPALTKWTPTYLADKIGHRTVEVQADRSSNTDFERQKDLHRRQMPFNAFIELIEQPEAGNSLYITAYNSAANEAAFEPLNEDVGTIASVLDESTPGSKGMLWIGPEGTFTPLHHDLTNNLLVQIRGRKRILMVSPTEYSKLYNDDHVFSEIRDVLNVDEGRHPLASDLHFYDITLNEGDAIFIPICWWHQVTALDFSISSTYTNFKWPNDAHLTYPGI